MSNVISYWANKHPERIINADDLENLAATGKTRLEISIALKMNYQLFCKKLSNSQRLLAAFERGQVRYVQTLAKQGHIRRVA
jgi:dTDP-D-glucose 4,6-dehydratase